MFDIISISALPFQSLCLRLFGISGKTMVINSSFFSQSITGDSQAIDSIITRPKDPFQLIGNSVATTLPYKIRDRNLILADTAKCLYLQIIQFMLKQRFLLITNAVVIMKMAQRVSDLEALHELPLGSEFA